MSHHIPTEISLHQMSRLLVVTFEDGRRFELPCEYLRVFSQAAEMRSLRIPLVGKEEVNIERIEAQGGYAVRLIFDDGHDTGIYSWDTLYELGEHQEAHWADYLRRIEAAGLQRGSTNQTDTPRTLKLLYFVYLPRAFGLEMEQVTLPSEVQEVRQLLTFLRRRGGDWKRLLDPDLVQVTVNKQFSEPFTRLVGGGEVAFVPTSPEPPDI